MGSPVQKVGFPVLSDEFTILGTTNEEIKPSQHLASVAKVPRFKFAESYGVVGDFGVMHFQKLNLNWLRIWYSHYLMSHPTLIRSRIEQPILEAHVTLKRHMAQSLGKSTNTLLDSGEFNITHTPYVENRAYFDSDGEYVTFDIHPSEHFLRNAAQDFPQLDRFLEQASKEKEKAISLLKYRSFLSPEMEVLVRKIIAYQSGPDALRVYTEVLAQELLMLFLIRSQGINATATKPQGKHTDAMLHLREVLRYQAEEYDFEDNYDTELDLANRVGLTLYQMKTAFRRTFGMPPYQMLMDFRFQRARKYLLDTRLSVFDIGLKIGYKSRESFIKAYKKRFSVPPTTYRQKSESD
ncbi:helix-turn-helix transcriptional regulator [Niabella insulamsoli]|uniref:helix-turn-helix transcriptional regulator n=1 Tax=Niabella insulamsoli TaxID=3144874 RepID=UPI0031FCC8F4